MEERGISDDKTNNFRGTCCMKVHEMKQKLHEAVHLFICSWTVSFPLGAILSLRNRNCLFLLALVKLDCTKRENYSFPIQSNHQIPSGLVCGVYSFGQLCYTILLSPVPLWMILTFWSRLAVQYPCKQWKCISLLGFSRHHPPQSTWHCAGMWQLVSHCTSSF